MMRQFNTMPGEIRDITGVKLEVFKRELDRWLNKVLDIPDINEYRAAVNINSIMHQAPHEEQVGEWNK